MEYFEGLKWIAENYGVWVAIVVYFLVRDAWRDYRQDKVINQLQAEMRGVILPIVQESTRVITENTSTMKDAKSTLRDCKLAIQECRIALSSRKPLLAEGGD